MARERSDAPGFEWKKERSGMIVPRWRARKKAVALGYRPAIIQLDIDPNDHAAIAERCREEWAKMEAWIANEHSEPRFDGTFGSMIDIYMRATRTRRIRSCDTGRKSITTKVFGC